MIRICGWALILSTAGPLLAELPSDSPLLRAALEAPLKDSPEIIFAQRVTD